MSFDITFLGASGGHLENNNCSLLIKPTNVSYEDVLLNPTFLNLLLCIDAGCGLSALTEIIYNEAFLHQPIERLGYLYDKIRTREILDASSIPTSTPFACLNRSDISSPFKISQVIFNRFKSYLISHPHLDHISGLIVNSSGLSEKYPKQVYGSNYTTSSIQKYIFNDVIWPNMVNYKMIKLNPNPYNVDFRINDNNYIITMFELCHGRFPKTKESYQSTAFLIQYPILKSYLLVFGDFESDTASNLKSNENIWQLVAPLIISDKLSSIIMECSHYGSTSALYGHLTPDHLFLELKQLKSQCLKLNDKMINPLVGLKIIINHVKEPVIETTKDELFDPRMLILKRLNELNEREGLGVKFSIALSGITYTV